MIKSCVDDILNSKPILLPAAIGCPYCFSRAAGFVTDLSEISHKIGCLYRMHKEAKDVFRLTDEQLDEAFDLAKSVEVPNHLNDPKKFLK